MMPYQVRKAEWFEALFALTVLFSITDTLTTSGALAIGLGEGNFLLLASARYLGLSVLTILIIAKAMIICGSAIFAFLAVHSKDARVTDFIFFTLASGVLVLVIASVYNLLVILVIGA